MPSSSSSTAGPDPMGPLNPPGPPTGPAGAAELRAELLAAGVLVETSVAGVYLRSAAFEGVLAGLDALISRAAPPGYEPMLYLPPVMARTDFVRTDYLRSFPNLTGSVDTFAGGDAEHAALLRLADAGGDWTTALVPADVVLSSAACHPVYAGLAGTVPDEGRRLEVQGYCFRHEPSLDPTRMQSFRMHEFVHVGTPDSAVAHRDEWLGRAVELLEALGLPVSTVVANDPFFGRAGRMLAANQRHTELKFEIVCPVTSSEHPTAISSGNYHVDHFGDPFGIRLADGSTAHSACLGFGLERVTLALLSTHGTDPSRWPADVRGLLGR